MMISFIRVNAQTVALLPMGLKKYSGSSDSIVDITARIRNCKRGRTVCSIALSIDIEYADGALVSHTLLCYTHHLGVVLVERDPLYCCRELPRIETFPGRYIP